MITVGVVFSLKVILVVWNGLVNGTDPVIPIVPFTPVVPVIANFPYTEEHCAPVAPVIPTPVAPVIHLML